MRGLAGDVGDDSCVVTQCGASTYGVHTQSKVIFDKIFKDNQWIQEVISLDDSYNPSPVVALVGCDLPKLYHGASSPVYLALVISDWDGDARYHRQQLFESFKDQNYVFDEKAMEVQFSDSKITLHIGDAVQSPEWIHMRDPGRLFRLHNKGLQTAALYFGDDTLYHIGPDHIGGIDDFSAKKKKRVQYICSIRMMWGDGSYIYRVMRVDEIPFRLVSKRICVGERRWIHSWRLAGADENSWRIIDV